MKIILAPDSFKESLSALNVIQALKDGIIKETTNADILEFPMADGGEGTLDALVHATGGNYTSLQVHDPLMRKTDAKYGVLGDNETCLIEIAQAVGLHLVKPFERNPYVTTSFGIGEMILHALEAGYRKFIIGLGGSSTNDGGAGMLQALGLKLLDDTGNPIYLTGGAMLEKIHAIDSTQFDSRILNCDFIIATDVRNPLLGPDGATYVFGKQKGASKDMLINLESGLKNFADIILDQHKISIHSKPGAGAAGGLGGAFSAFFNADFENGIDLVLKYSGFEKALVNADLIITGEGKTDFQTKFGKVASGVAKLGKKYNVPTIIISGSVDNNIEELFEDGVLSVFSIINKPMSLENAIIHASELITHTSSQIIRTFIYNKQL